MKVKNPALKVENGEPQTESLWVAFLFFMAAAWEVDGESF